MCHCAKTENKTFFLATTNKLWNHLRLQAPDARLAKARTGPVALARGIARRPEDDHEMGRRAMRLNGPRSGGWVEILHKNIVRRRHRIVGKNHCAIKDAARAAIDLPLVAL
jgi:hypothetical protein